MDNFYFTCSYTATYICSHTATYRADFEKLHVAAQLQYFADFFILYVVAQLHIYKVYHTI